MTQIPLGTIRIGAGGAHFDFPYFSESGFGEIVSAIRRDQYFSSGAVFVPYHAISFILKIPHNSIEHMQAQHEALGETKQ